MLVPNCTLYWSKVQSPDTPKNTRIKPSWQVTVVLDNPDIISFATTNNIYVRPKNDSTPFDHFIAKRNTRTKKGKEQKAPRVVNQHKVEVKKLLGNGTKANLSVELFEYEDDDGNKKKSVYLKAVQVTKLIEYGDDDDGLGEFTSLPDDSLADF